MTIDVSLYNSVWEYVNNEVRGTYSQVESWVALNYRVEREVDYTHCCSRVDSSAVLIIDYEYTTKRGKKRKGTARVSSEDLFDLVEGAIRNGLGSKL